MNTFIVLSALLAVGYGIPTNNKAIIKDVPLNKNDTMEISEELYNVLKPMTEYYFHKIMKVFGKSEEKSSPNPPIMKKISKSLYNAAVSPMMKFYLKNMNNILPLGYKKAMEKSLSKSNNPQIHKDNSSSECQTCLYVDNYDCGTCAFLYACSC